MVCKFRNAVVATVVVFGLFLCPESSLVAEEQPGVIPYQGQLADQSGKPVNPTDPITLVFRVYSQPVGGTPSWQEVHESVSVVGGRFSVLLGVGEPFPDLALFRQTVYLGVTVDDGEPATADIEMRPRQAIVPVIAASYSATAGHADQTPGEVPVGGITMYGGTEGELPANWRICNGDVVVDPLSPFDGKRVPDLRGLFVRGAETAMQTRQGGGSERVESHTHEVPRHRHYVDIDIEMSRDSVDSWMTRELLCSDRDGDGSCDEDGRGFWLLGDVKIRPSKRYRALVLDVDDGGNFRESHSHVGIADGRTKWKNSVFTDSGGSGDNRPPFMNVHYIIRIR